MSEQQVRDRGIPYECGLARFRETSRGHIMGLNAGMMKMLFAIGTGRLLGVHIVGEGATELIHIGQAVLNLQGTLDYFIERRWTPGTGWRRNGRLGPSDERASACGEPTPLNMNRQSPAARA